MKVRIVILMVLGLAVMLQPLRAQTLDDAAQYAPMAAAIALDYCGVETRHPLRERIALTATSYAALTAMAGGLKLTISERRPDGSDTRSFPSGHAARAFAGAELVRSEYGWNWGLGAYAWAAGVSVLRITGDHHYAHDVLAGAAVGVLSARLAYWLLPFERRVFGWASKNVTVGALPTYEHNTRSLGIALTATLH
ncbi:MAG: phosphatase PAP2 family protein [Prevotella sp.]|nr:phosphatase PAP2 family protein [Prevotella sp.]